MRTVKSYRYYAYFTIRNVHLKQLSTEKLVERDLKSSTRETHARKHNAIREHTTRSPLGPPARTYACNDHDVPYVQRTRYYIVNNDIVYSRVCTYIQCTNDKIADVARALCNVRVSWPRGYIHHVRT